MDYKQVLKFYPNFPIHGVNFVDIIPFLQDKEVFKALTDDIGRTCASPNILAPEARGFLFTAPLLYSGMAENVIPVRKKGKLPFSEGDLITVDIVKEYGKDQVFYRLSRHRRHGPRHRGEPEQPENYHRRKGIPREGHRLCLPGGDRRPPGTRPDRGPRPGEVTDPRDGRIDS